MNGNGNQFNVIIDFVPLLSPISSPYLAEYSDGVAKLQLVLSPPTSDKADCITQGGRAQLSKIWYPSFTFGSKVVL